MNIPLWSAIILGIWTALGPLVGIFIGHWLTKSWQREQWIADERTKEWRELLGTLTTSLATVVRSSVGDKTVEMMQEESRATIAATEVLSNRLFIAQEVRRLKLLDRWSQAVATFQQDRDPVALGEKFGREIRFQIEEGARKDIGMV